MTQQKKMYKVITAVDKKGGGTYWMRLGTGFTNRDDSINLYLDAMPATSGSPGRYELQIRELDAEDLRKRESFNASNGAGNGRNGSNGGTGGNGDAGGLDGLGGQGGGGSGFDSNLGSSFGSGPNASAGSGFSSRDSRTVTASRSSDEIPF